MAGFMATAPAGQKTLIPQSIGSSVSPLLIPDNMQSLARGSADMPALPLTDICAPE